MNCFRWNLMSAAFIRPRWLLHDRQTREHVTCECDVCMTTSFLHSERYGCSDAERDKMYCLWFFVVSFIVNVAVGYEARSGIVQCRPNMICPLTRKEVCGSDGKTYLNTCELLRGRCLSGGQVTFKYRGPCGTGNLCNQWCKIEYKPICGSDDKTYSSECMLERLNCLYRKNVVKRSDGSCNRGKTCDKKCDNSYDPVCATNGRTFRNRCLFDVADCKDRGRLEINHEGECGTCEKTCPRIYKLVCGTDGRTYTNDCLLSVVTCKSGGRVTKKNDGACNTCDKSCPAERKPVCGTNDETYRSECDLEVAACRQPALEIQKAYNGKCLSRAELCTLNAERGDSSCGVIVKLRRFYYNPNLGRCDEFLYEGCNGNANNFESRALCENKCARDCSDACSTIYEPVCGSDDKTYTNECQLKIASCRSWEKIRKVSDGTCTGGVTNACDGERYAGQCNTRRQRLRYAGYYYNSVSRKCVRFSYGTGACAPGENNFEDLKSCELQCADKPSTTCELDKFPGPCTQYSRRWFFNRRSRRCEIFTYGGCDSNGNNFLSKDACEKRCGSVEEKDVCFRPSFQGPCEATITRWFFNVETGRCETFTHGGCNSNGNNFESLTECRRRCVSTVDACSQGKSAGNCGERIMRWFFNSDSGRCETFIYSGCGNNGNNFPTHEECRKKCGTPVDVCDLEKFPGPCKSRVTRWYFNKISGKCEKFIYGGCNANGNNFQTLDACLKRCNNVCQLDKEPGPCVRHVTRWFFNVKSGQCEAFVYGGCHGNANNFINRLDCEKKCRESCDRSCTLDGPQMCGSDGKTYVNRCFLEIQTCLTRGAVQESHTGACPKQICTEPKLDASRCNSLTTRYVYNTKTGFCDAVLGCQGHGNNFETADDCRNMCVRSCADSCLTIHEPVCGSDGTTYSNMCFLNIMSCRSWGRITLEHAGPCGGQIQ